MHLEDKFAPDNDDSEMTPVNRLHVLTLSKLQKAAVLASLQQARFNYIPRRVGSIA